MWQMIAMCPRFEPGYRIIYPDTSDLEWLTRHSGLTPSQFDDKLADTGAFLGLSTVHILETARGKAPELKIQRAEWLDQVNRHRWLIHPREILFRELDAEFVRMGYGSAGSRGHVHYRTLREAMRNFDGGGEGFRAALEVFAEDVSMLDGFDELYAAYVKQLTHVRAARMGKVPREGNVAYLRKVYATPLPDIAWAQLSIDRLRGATVFFAVADALNRRTEPPTASDLGDTEHLKYLPYVNILCTDKRMLTLINQSARVPKELKRKARRRLESVIAEIS
jgi:hypothetical protein